MLQDPTTTTSIMAALGGDASSPVDDMEGARRARKTRRDRRDSDVRGSGVPGGLDEKSRSSSNADGARKASAPSASKKISAPAKSI